MDLAQYLESHDISQAQFSRKTGIGKVTLNRILMKKQFPNLKTALKIEKETYGKVTCEELVSGMSQEKGKKKQASSTKSKNNKPKLRVIKKSIP